MAGRSVPAAESLLDWANAAAVQARSKSSAGSAGAQERKDDGTMGCAKGLVSEFQESGIQDACVGAEARRWTRRHSQNAATVARMTAELRNA